jgi:hypothetical protein
MNTAVGEIRGLVRSATVAVVHEPSGEPERVRGSGFFVAPGIVLTCAHVVLDSRGPLFRRMDGHDGPVTAVVLDDHLRTVFSAGRDGRIRKWGRESPTADLLLATTDPILPAPAPHLAALAALVREYSIPRATP